MNDSLSKSTDSKEIILYFYEHVMNSKIDNNISKYIIMAKRLLTKYSKDEIIYTMDYCSKHKPSGGIYSFGYISAIIEDTIKPYRKEKLKEKVKKAEEESKEIGTLPRASDNSKKLKNFGKREEFDWNA